MCHGKHCLDYVFIRLRQSTNRHTKDSSDSCYSLQKTGKCQKCGEKITIPNKQTSADDLSIKQQEAGPRHTPKRYSTVQVTNTDTLQGWTIQHYYGPVSESIAR